MDKIFKGIVTGHGVDITSKRKFLKLIEASGNHQHQNDEVEHVLQIALFTWTSQLQNGANDLDHIHMAKDASCLIYKSWSKNRAQLSYNVTLAFLKEALQGDAMTLMKDIKGFCDVLLCFYQLHCVSSGVDLSAKDVLDLGITKLTTHASSMDSLAYIADTLQNATGLISLTSATTLLTVLVSKLGSLVANNIDGKSVVKYIHDSSIVSKLVRFIWTQSTAPKELILHTLKALLSITSQEKTEEVSLSMATVIQSVPEVG